MLKKLAAYRRQNRLDFALQELGRIERTLFTLDWLESRALRQQCQAGLNKGEARHHARPSRVRPQTGPACAIRSSRTRR